MTSWRDGRSDGTFAQEQTSPAVEWGIEKIVSKHQLAALHKRPFTLSAAEDKHTPPEVSDRSLQAGLSKKTQIGSTI